MSDKIKEILETPVIPDELKPENIPELLEKRGGKGSSDGGTETDGVLREESVKTLDGSGKSGKKKIIRRVCTYSAVAAACVLIVGGVMKFVPHEKNDMMTAEMFIGTTNGINADDKSKNPASKAEEAASDNAESYEEEAVESTYSGTFAYVNAKSYELLFDRAKEASVTRYELNGVIGEEEARGADTVDSSLDYNSQIKGDGSETDVYNTLSQVEGIAEADIIKANDRGVFYVTNNEPVYVSAYYGKSVTYIPVDKKTGKFGEKYKIEVAADAGIPEASWFDVSAMYLTDKKLTVIISSWYNEVDGVPKPATTTVLTYDVTGETPVFSGKGVQSGSYSSSRMNGDILWLVTDQNSWNIFTEYNYYDDEEVSDTRTYADTDKRLYVPFYGASYEKAECLDLSCIYLPVNDDQGCDTLMISGININSPESAISSTAVSGYTGDIYCTADALYIQQVNFEEGSGWYGDSTTISKFDLADGVITPRASGKVNGTVLDQFSMSEYSGYFRVATTLYEWNEKKGTTNTSNSLFVLDENLNVVGSVTDIAPTETIKSVNFQGNTAYVVTYERTDPLFAIDLSDPSSPVITDELKINGYSSFLWKWDDEHLIGFGVDATDEGIETGVKLVMFDVSDNGELKEDGYYAISSGKFYHSTYSYAVYDRKALLLAPDKNLIGFPLEESDEDWNYKHSYALFSYADGEFTEKGRIESESEYTNFERGLYIGDHLFVFSQDEAVSVDIETMTETDRTEFETMNNIKKNEEPVRYGYDINE
ncbi:MAG: beta-propeller domain-containing protein [Oscillospiraceae bacterium]|nr:beta-propeller domain-containing protein [Oscillospiraceae bacterium]